MPRNRVLSFMSQWGSRSRDSSPTASPITRSADRDADNGQRLAAIDTAAAQASSQNVAPYSQHSPPPRSPATPSRARADSRAGSRPLSMVQTYQPPQVDIASDTPPELQPIFNYLNSHGNKLYQEGYFLKLHDLDSRGRPSADRTWVECFAQLVGTVLSLWDAAALDAAGVDGEVVPTFINLSDASLKMIESLPMSGAQGGKLQNVLSISTAANNRYLLHFNSLNSLTQWTAGIRLAMFEHTTLQEAYTGSLVAGKGRLLNGIREIMERSRFPTEDWARVRFGAGTPWRRLWFVITPADEKDYQKVQKMQKKGTSYLRSQLPRGDIKFYDTRKITKKTKPIATINDVYAAYAIYPQSKPLIEQSTLVKMEGLVTIHSSPETTAEGFVFVMPEVHPAVSGFEMMLRWLFPVWDTFNLYGRPTRLIADSLDQRGLMFAMPRDRRYGYLDILDVSALIHERGSQTWSERQWRKQLKKLTAERMNAQLEGGPYAQGHRRSVTGSQSSLPIARQGVRFSDTGSTHSTPSRSASPAPGPGAGPQNNAFSPSKRSDTGSAAQRVSPHKRAASEAQNYKRYQSPQPSRLSHELAGPNVEYGPVPPQHANPGRSQPAPGMLQRIESGIATPTMASLQAGLHPTTDPAEVPPEPISSPPAFTHNPGSRPANRPAAPAELRREIAGVDEATMYQMQDVVRPAQNYEHDHGNLASNTMPPSFDQRRQLPDRSQGVPNFNGTPPMNNHEFFGGAGGPGVERARRSPDSRNHPLPSVPHEQRPLLEPSRSSNSVTRKPVTRKPINPLQGTSTPSSEHGSLAQSYIDHDALERILQQENRLDSMNSMGSSATPDYASTKSASSQGKKSPEKPRMGQLKTVGDPEMLPLDMQTAKLDTWRQDKQAGSADIPIIDFGPTYSLKPDMRSGAGRQLADKSRSRSRDRLSAHLTGSNRNSPGDAKRLSYFDANADTYQQESRYSVAWTPPATTTMAAAATKSGSISMTPEQWVQHRAAIAGQPQLAPRPSAPIESHSRQSSTSTLSQRRLTKTPPPFGRSGSGDWSQLGRQTPPSRPGSRGAGTYLGQSSPGLSARQTPPSRPASRGAGTYFAQASPGLSAKEQMYVAKSTGTPMLGTSSIPKLQDNGSATLLDAVAVREREKAAVKEGLRTSMVDEAIRSRQQQAYVNNAEALRQAAMRAQQQSQQTAIALQVRQNASSISPSLLQTQRQSWIPQPTYVFHNQQPTGFNSNGSGMLHNGSNPPSPFSSPFAQRLYDGQQQHAFVAQQGRPSNRQSSADYGR